ncbi:MAG: permease, partial [Pseudonocardiaceae bacterium]
MSAAWHLIGGGFAMALSMLWETLWALVLGFALSGIVQAFVSRQAMQRVLGVLTPTTVTRASLLGAASSSCSYAASALAKSLFARSADFTASMIFMFASTNLNIAIGLVIWTLVGWQFALAQFVGGAIMIVLLAVSVPRMIPRRMLQPARDRLSESAERDQQDGVEPLERRLRRPEGWATAASYTISDLTMLRKELIGGLVIAGFLMVGMPASWWQALFLTGHGFWSSLENSLLGPLIALISFVCSVGNVPLAAAVWHGGISFGGTIAFIFADLITLPLVLIYRKYYGTAIALRLLGVFWVVMSASGLITEYLFSAAGLIPATHQTARAMTGVSWNYTT